MVGAGGSASGPALAGGLAVLYEPGTCIPEAFPAFPSTDGVAPSVHDVAGEQEKRMSSHTLTADVYATGGDNTKSSRGWIIFAGITLLVCGVAAIVYDG